MALASTILPRNHGDHAEADTSRWLRPPIARDLLVGPSLNTLTSGEIAFRFLRPGSERRFVSFLLSDPIIIADIATSLIIAPTSPTSIESQRGCPGLGRERDVTQSSDQR